MSGGDIIGDRLILGDWVIYPDGEKLFAITPAGVHVQFEMIDYTLVLGPQPTTPPDYVPPTLTSTSEGYNTTVPANVASSTA